MCVCTYICVLSLQKRCLSVLRSRMLVHALNTICIAKSRCTIRLCMIGHFMQILTMFGGKCVQEFLYEEMYKAQTNGRKSKYTECYTATIQFHEVTTKKTARRNANAFEYRSNYSLFQVEIQ